MIHYFNPGHETAVLNRSKYYQPAANQVKMQQDLAMLPAWYAEKDDWVCLGRESFIRVSNTVNNFLSGRETVDLSYSHVPFDSLKRQAVDLWGVSPQAIHLFHQLDKQYNLELELPEWSEQLRTLSSRITARDCLKGLVETIPGIDSGIIPAYYNSLSELETTLDNCTTKQVLKSPYSSSGRGLLWLPPGGLGRSERQIISGILRKQGEVSLEPALDKVLDFSMHFDLKSGIVDFIGYSLFNTNTKGAYEKTLLHNQMATEQEITSYVSPFLLERVVAEHICFLQKDIAPYYNGKLGIDMLIYQQDGEYKLNPCVEINMRKSMGLLSLLFYQNYVRQGACGEYHVDYASAPGKLLERHKQMQKEFPLLVKEGEIQSGYLSLCPVGESTNYRAYVRIF